MAYSIVWSADAADEVLDIVAFQKAKYGARRALQVYNGLHDRVAVTQLHPESGRAVPELVAIGITDIRELIESPWRILYAVTESRIEVLSVIDGRRNFEEILYRKVIDGKLT